MMIKAVLHEAKEGGYWAEVPALPGCISEGDNLEELKSNLKEAITGWLEVYNEELDKKVSSSFKVLELAV
jgi:predicted RNase H-like HicB family nuclease